MSDRYRFRDLGDETLVYDEQTREVHLLAPGVDRRTFLRSAAVVGTSALVIGTVEAPAAFAAGSTTTSTTVKSLFMTYSQTSPVANGESSVQPQSSASPLPFQYSLFSSTSKPSSSSGAGSVNTSLNATSLTGNSNTNRFQENGAGSNPNTTLAATAFAGNAQQLTAQVNNQGGGATSSTPTYSLLVKGTLPTGTYPKGLTVQVSWTTSKSTFYVLDSTGGYTATSVAAATNATTGASNSPLTVAYPNATGGSYYVFAYDGDPTSSDNFGLEVQFSY